MTMQGKIISWNNGKGYGFIAPSGGGDNVFIHKTAFSNRQRIPQKNDEVSFSITKDKQGRYCAGEAFYAGEKRQAKHSGKLSSFSVYLSIIFIVALALAQLMGHIPKYFVVAYLGLSVTTFILYALDKSKAQKGAWRISESTLHMFSIAGGWPGAAIAQQALRHKSQKKQFRFVYWLSVVANCGGLAWLLSPEGAQYIERFY